MDVLSKGGCLFANDASFYREAGDLKGKEGALATFIFVRTYFVYIYSISMHIKRGSQVACDIDDGPRLANRKLLSQPHVIIIYDLA
jgi:hypothetical protein